MNDHDFQRPSIDDAIDSAVRDLMHRDPRPGLRRRVLANLDEPARRGAWTWMLAPACVLACLLVAVVLFGNWERGEVPLATTNTPPAATAPATVPSPPAPAASAPAVAAREPGEPQSPAPLARANEGANIFGPPQNRVSAASVRANDAPPAMGDNLPTPPVESGLARLSLPGRQIKPQLPALTPRR